LKVRRQLKTKRDDTIRQAAELLLNDDRANVDDHLHRIDAYHKLLTTSPNRARELGSAAVLALLLVTVAGLTWGLHVSKTKFILTAHAEAITLKLAAPWAWSGELPVDPNPLSIEELTLLMLPAPGPTIKRLERSPWARIEGGKVSLTRLGLGQGGALLLENGDRRLVFVYASGARFTGELAVWGAPQISAGAGGAGTDFVARLDLAVPETILFQADGRGVVPARLRMRPSDPLVLNDLRVQGLSFLRDIAEQPGTVGFVSTLIDGRLVLKDIAETVDLRTGEHLSLEGVTGRVTEMRVSDPLGITFEGSAREIRTGPEGFQRDLRPTYLGYLYHERRLPFFFSTIGFLWGMLWAVRKMLFS
jgi:hypothetical protein